MRNLTFLIAFFFMFAVATTAQQKKYISYEIKKGETLKSIAKQYSLSTRDLARLNPGVRKKPALGTVIIVPNLNYGKIIVEKAVEKPTIYIAKPKETVFGISKKFGVSIDELIALNPSLKDGLKIGMELTIPKPVIAQPKDSINFVMHTVIKDDTMFNLTRRFSVTEEELNKLNPHLTEGLKLGMLLKIKAINPELAENDLRKDSVAVFIENINRSKRIKLAIILPYQLNKYQDTLIKQSFEKSNSILNIVTDFHLGAQMAIDSLKQKGLKIDVSYFDSENSNQKLRKIVNANNKFDDTDLIIGPLFFKKAHWVSQQTNAKVVAPLFSKSQDTLNSRNIVKSAPNSKAYQEKLLKYLKDNYKGENILIVNDGKKETQSQLWYMVSEIKKFDSIQTVSVIKLKDGYINRKIFEKKLDSTTNNWVVLLSKENVTTSTTVNNLKGFTEKMNINLFSLNKGSNFNNIDNTFLGKLNFVYTTSSFFNTEDILTTKFYNKYYKKNKSYPSKYAFRGFDVTYDALIRLASCSDDYDCEDFLSSDKSIRSNSVFGYEKNQYGSLENKQIVLIKYNEDLTTEIIE